MVGLVLVPAGLLFIYWVALRSPRFSGRRAAMSVRSLRGHNIGLYFAVFGLADLVMSAAGHLSADGIATSSTGELLGALLAALVVALVLLPGAEFMLAALGAAASTLGAFLQYGLAGGILFLVVALLALTFLSLVRGLAPGRR